jgi:hypothetical protein
MNWRSIRLELGSTGQFPAGSVSRSYIIRLPLNEADHVDSGAVAEYPRRATVQRHWSTEPDENGFVVQAGLDWALRCDDRERILQLNGTPVRLGHQVSVVESDGSALPFTIASIR